MRDLFLLKIYKTIHTPTSELNQRRNFFILCPIQSFELRSGFQSPYVNTISQLVNPLSARVVLIGSQIICIDKGLSSWQQVVAGT